MNYCQFRNDFIKRMANAGGGGILPAEYQQVEYIQTAYNNGGDSTNGGNRQYIVTGVNYFADCEIDAQLTNISYGGKLIGINTNTCIQRISAANPVFSCWNSRSSYYATTANIYTRHVIRWANNNIYVDGNYVTGFTKQSYNAPLVLLGTGTMNDSGYYQSWAYARCYNCKLWDTGGNKIRDFIPCYRKADDKTGMYDLVTNTFFANAGTGEFTVGIDVL